jgi:hypothetical protein
MTQDERWLLQYQQMMDFLETYHRRPSKHRVEEHLLLNWWRRCEKLYVKGELPVHRIEKFEALLEAAQKYRRKNQYAYY